MKISIAQTRSIKGNISANIDAHKEIIELAVSYKVDSLFFPELSLTGYEPALARELATNENSDQFEEFQEISDKNKITIGVGVPTKTNNAIRISMMIFQPNVSRQTYSKQLLHTDEFPYFVSGKKQTILIVDNKKIAPAICYESLHPDHSDHAKKLGAEIYIASVAKSQNEINNALTYYSEVAKKLSITVLMSNCIGYCDNFESAVQSAIWSNRGELAGQLDNTLEGLLIFDTETEEVIKHILQK